MTWNIALFVIALLQQPPAATMPRVTICLLDGKQVTISGAEFSGFIDGPISQAVLTYREKGVHGQMPVAIISKIEFGPYAKGKPFLLSLTLKNGQRLQVESERHDFLTVAGNTDLGLVRIKHPDPLVGPVRLNTKRPDRKHDLTIQYLEFPTS
jgi:hypothetical protein